MFLYKQKVTSFLYALIFLSSIFVAHAHATTANPGFISFQKNDGKIIKLKIKGDEVLSWYETVNGNIYVSHNNDLYFSALNQNNKLVASEFTIHERPPVGFRVLNIGDSDVAEAIADQMSHAHSHGHFHVHEPDVAGLTANGLSSPSIQSSRNLLTIAISFNDVQIDGSREFWVNKVYQTTAQYFADVSRGQFEYIPANETNDVANDGLIKVTLNRDHPDLGRNSDKEVLLQALEQADTAIDFSQYDADGNGVITTQELNILFIFAGWETAISGEFQGPDVWAHVSSLFSTQVFDGITFSGRYARVGERHIDRLATFGIIAHELGHLSFNWPDLYDRTNNQNDGSNALGDWCLMASGSWNRNDGEFSGATPALPNPILRHMSGWEPTRMTAGEHVLSPTLEGGQAIKIDTNDPGHYVFLESKKVAGFDAATPLSEPGMLIWKYRISGSNSTRDNNTGAVIFPSYEVMNNVPNSEGQPGFATPSAQALWPTPGGVTSVGTATQPNLHIRAGFQQDVVFQQVWDINDISLLDNNNVRFVSSKAENAAPLVSVDGPSSAFINDTVIFDGSDTRDQDGVIVEYRWEGPWGTQVTSSPTFEHVFTALGPVTITLTATDNEGTSSSASIELLVVDASTPPVAEISGVANTTINLADSISFQATNSFDPKPNGGIVSTRWIGPWGDRLGSPFIFHRFLDPGEFTVRLIVTDRVGNTAEDSIVITVVDDGVNLPPVAVLADDSTVFKGFAYRFSVVDSFDEDGAIVEALWEGPWGTRTGNAFFYSFFDLGVFTVTLTVTDNEGASDSTTQTFTILEPVKQSNFESLNLRGTTNNWDASAMELVSDFTWQIEAIFGNEANERFKFDVNGDWSDNYGDNEGDGIAEAFGGDIAITEGPGRYIIRFDDRDLSYTIRKVLTPIAPTANAGADITVVVGSSVQFDGSASVDPDGTITSYAWSGDLSTDLTGVNPTQVFNTVGDFNVVLTVIDDSGLTDTDTLLVSVVDIADLQSTFEQVFARGVFNSWGTTSMVLVEDFVWELPVTFASSDNNEFKFDINGDWSLNFGDNNNDGIADPSGNNIIVNDGAGDYVIRFNDQNKSYSVVKTP